MSGLLPKPVRKKKKPVLDTSDSTNPEAAGKKSKPSLLDKLWKVDRHLLGCWAFNVALTVGLILWWGNQFREHQTQEDLTLEITYRLSRFMSEIKDLDQAHEQPVAFFIAPGRAPELLSEPVRELWENPPRRDIRFSWQNDAFGLPRGIIISAEDPRILQRIDRAYDDGDLGQGSARIHPGGLWLAIR